MEQASRTNELIVALGGEGYEIGGDLLFLSGKRMIGKTEIVRRETRLRADDLSANKDSGGGGVEFEPAQEGGTVAGFGAATNDGQHERGAHTIPCVFQKRTAEVAGEA